MDWFVCWAVQDDGLPADLFLESLFETGPFLVIAIDGAMDYLVPFLVAHPVKAFKLNGRFLSIIVDHGKE
jgi:hypothetical protein